MGSQIENLKIWQVGYQCTEKFSEKFNESVKKIFFGAPLSLRIQVALFIIIA